MNKTFSQAGWTLIELTVVVVVLGIIASMTAVYVGNNQDAYRYEETKQKMAAIRSALIGSDAVDTGGSRTHFGYVGDMGRLPTTLTDLVTMGTQASWVYNSTLGFGAGWRGPYINSQLSNSIEVTKDAWNNVFVYVSGATASVKSLAADNLSGGTGYSTDLMMQLAPEQTFATVTGTLKDGENAMGSKSVVVRYPLSGAITPISGTTTSLGYFSFSGIPYGVRSVEVSGSPSLGPNRFVVDGPNVSIPAAVLDYAGKGDITYVTSSLASTGTNTYDQVLFDVNSTYGSAITCDYFTVTWSQSAYLKSVIFDVTGTPVTSTLSNAPSGFRVALGGTQSISAGATNFRIKMTFASFPDGTGNADMRDVKMTVHFQWVGNGKQDSINFTTPTS